LDAGVRGSVDGEQVPSTIIDVTDLTRGGTTFRVIREGAVTAADLGRVLPEAIAR
jgi:tRNA A37 threonylcarbamoyladenosine synthetase subunit TsaC/SUA5/YrdC